MPADRGMRQYDNTPQEYANTAQETFRKAAEAARAVNEAGRVLAEKARTDNQTLILAKAQLAADAAAQLSNLLPTTTYTPQTLTLTSGVQTLTVPVGATKAKVTVTVGSALVNLGAGTADNAVQAGQAVSGTYPLGIPNGYAELGQGELAQFTIRGNPTATAIAEYSSGGVLGNAGGGLLSFSSDSAAYPRTPTVAELFSTSDNILGTRTANGTLQPVKWNRTTGQWGDYGQAFASASKLDTVAGALANTDLSQLANKAQADGPQFVNGYRWVWQTTGPANGGTVVAADPTRGGGFWAAEGVYRFNVRDFGAIGDGRDDTAAILRCIAAARAKYVATLVQTSIYFPNGYYIYRSTLRFDFRTQIVGEYGFGNAVTLLYDPADTVWAGVRNFTVDPRDVPAMEFVGKTVAGNNAELLYGVRLTNIQLAQPADANKTGLLDGIIWHGVSECIYDHLNVNGFFRRGVTYRGASGMFARMCNISNNRIGIYIENGEWVNWDIGAVSTMHSDMNIWQCAEAAIQLSGRTRHLGLQASWLEYNQRGLFIKSKAGESIYIEDIGFDQVQVSNGSAAVTPESRVMVADLTASGTNSAVVRNVRFRSVWSFLDAATSAFNVLMGTSSAASVQYEVDGVQVYGVPSGAVLCQSSSPVKVKVGSGDISGASHFDGGTPLSRYNYFDANSTPLGWRSPIGSNGLYTRTTQDGTVITRGTKRAVKVAATSLQVTVTYQLRANPVITVTRSTDSLTAGATVERVQVLNVTGTDAVLAVYGAGFGASDYVDLFVTVEGDVV